MSGLHPQGGALKFNLILRDADGIDACKSSVRISHAIGRQAISFNRSGVSSQSRSKKLYIPWLLSEQALTAICQDISCRETKHLGKLEQILAARCLDIRCSSTKHLLK
ncbi:hypothetical protein DPMN_161229 [Dreissena polymorpha]|uniref:Uncharacterized protein n=1 Tax=Dreissena polymorpha TaxID=45954 RepID=A0A9D4EMC0_DREPO|nr:hypothetical protein DPMN_161229 [Dreissena polymorpha]